MDCSEGCRTAAVMFGVPGVRVLAAVAEPDGLDLVVETDQTATGCGRCGVLAAAHGRREQVLHDAPFGHRRVRLRWRKRLWRCREPACATGTFTEQHDLVAPRAKLTAGRWPGRPTRWPTTTPPSRALARHLGVDWHTLWDAVEAEADRRLADPARLAGCQRSGRR